MAADRTFHVRSSNDGQTLASALRKMLGEEVSWGDIKRLVATRHIHVNGNLVVDEGRKLKTGDVVHVFEHARAPLPGEDDIVIRHLDADLVVIEKPAGLNTLRHREEHDLPQKRKDKAPTLEELLQRVIGRRIREGSVRFPTRPAERDQPSRAAPPPHPLFGSRQQAKPPSKDMRHSPKPPSRAQDPRRPQGRPAQPHTGPVTVPEVRPVHRLDRDTSGLMLFALTPAAEMALERDFARHSVERKYMAVVHGHLAEPKTIETYLVRDRGDGLRGSSPKGPNAPDSQRALTRVTPLEKVGPYTIVECQLETGRTHQIRIHLAEIGHRLCGEKTYTHALGEPPQPDKSGCPRHALHSAKLRFTHPTTGGEMKFESGWPRELAAWLRKIRS